MSVQALTWALESAQGIDPKTGEIIDVPPHLIAALIGLANHAQDDGSGSWVAASTIAHYIRKNERNTRRDLAQLQELDVIRLGDQRIVLHIPEHQRPMVYDLAMYYASERRRPKRPKSTPGRPKKSVSKPPVAGDTPPVDNPPKTPCRRRHPLSQATPKPPGFNQEVKPPPTSSTDHESENPAVAANTAGEEKRGGGGEKEEKRQEALNALNPLLAAYRPPSKKLQARLVAGVAQALSAGWSAKALTTTLKADLGSANYPPAVWAARLESLGTPPAVAKTNDERPRCPKHDELLVWEYMFSDSEGRSQPGCKTCTQALTDETEPSETDAERSSKHDLVEFLRRELRNKSAKIRELENV